jgi:hypothetical protein
MAKSIHQIMKDFNNKLNKLSAFFLDRQDAWLGNYAGVVDVPNKEGMVYVRLQSGQVVEALNTVAPSIHNWAVTVGKDKSQPHVFRVLETRMVHPNGDTPSYVKFHHEQHEFPGPDTVFVYRDQFMPLLVYPLGGLSLQLFGDIIYSIGMSNPIRVPDTVIDMTSYVPASGAEYVLIEVETDGTLNYIIGTNYDSREILEVSGDIPAPTPNNVPICAVIMFAGQTEVRRDFNRRDIIDLRMFVVGNGDAHSHDNIPLDDIIDVDAPAPTDDQILTYDASDATWQAKDIPFRRVLMVTGITHPPVPVESADGTDWIYST